MRTLKILYSIVLWMFMPMISFAVDLELSDVIKEARQSQMQIADKNQIKENVSQIKQQYSMQGEQGEKNASEKLNPEEIMKQDKK